MGEGVGVSAYLSNILPELDELRYLHIVPFQ